MWKKGDILIGSISGARVIFIEYNKNDPKLFVGTDVDGDTFEDWVVELFSKEDDAK